METIKYKGIEYPAKYIANGALISVEDLNDILNEDFSDPLLFSEANYIDEQICGFVSREEINLPEKQLVELCKEYGIL